MTDPKQKDKFKTTINGKVCEFKHHSRHKANSRSVALTKYCDNLREKERPITKEITQTFKTGYNMGYDEAKKRTRQLKESEGEDLC